MDLNTLKDAIELVGLPELTINLYSKQVISFYIQNKVIAKQIDSIELLTAVIRILQICSHQRQNFYMFIKSLRLLDDVTQTFSCLEARYFSLIQMKLIGKVSMECDRKFSITISVIDSRAMKCPSRNYNEVDLLWIALQLRDWRKIVDGNKNIGKIEIEMLNKHSTQPIYEVISSKLGFLELKVNLPNDSPTEYNIRFSLKKLHIWGNVVNDFQCDYVTLTIKNVHRVGVATKKDQNDTIVRERGYFFMVYENELTGDNFDETCEQFRRSLLTNNHCETLRLITEIIHDELRTPAEKAFFMCYHAITLSHCGKDQIAKVLLYEAWSKVQNGTKNNELLAQGRIRRILAGIYDSEGNESEALNNIQICKQALETARPSCEKACILIREAIILKKCNVSAEAVAQLFESAHKCILQCTDTKRKVLMLPMASIERALFLLELKQVEEAKQCLKDFNDCPRIKTGNNIYQLKFLIAQSEVFRLSGDYTNAQRFIHESETLVVSGVVKITQIEKEELKIHEKKTIIAKKLE